MNKLGLIKFCNLFWGNHLRYFGDKISLDEPLVLSRSFCTKTTQSTTAITSIVIRLANQLRIKRESAIFRHCEANHRFAEAIKNKNQSARSVNPCKSFCYFLLLQKVESPFFIDSALDSQSIRATNRNGRNCGGVFVFGEKFGSEARLGVCEIPKILTSAKDAPKSELSAQAEFVRLWV